MRVGAGVTGRPKTAGTSAWASPGPPAAATARGAARHLRGRERRVTEPGSGRHLNGTLNGANDFGASRGGSRASPLKRERAPSNPFLGTSFGVAGSFGAVFGADSLGGTPETGGLFPGSFGAHSPGGGGAAKMAAMVAGARGGGGVFGSMKDDLHVGSLGHDASWTTRCRRARSISGARRWTRSGTSCTHWGRTATAARDPARDPSAAARAAALAMKKSGRAAAAAAGPSGRRSGGGAAGASARVGRGGGS